MKTKLLNKKLVQLVKLLNDGEYHDGKILAASLKIARSTVYKMIKKLQEYNIAIDSVRSMGYSLKESLILLDPNRIKKSLTSSVELTVLESIDSTNRYLKGQKKKSGIRCCFAEYQSQGRGRLSRCWHSPFGKNIYFSCAYVFKKNVNELAGLSLVVSLSITKTLKTLGITKGLCVKWPNDVLCQEKKISGILIDIHAESHGVTQAIIGIGLNVNMKHDDLKNSENGINQPWTSLQEETKTEYDRNYAAAILMQCLLEYLYRFEMNNFLDFMDEWKKVDGLMNKEITLNCYETFITGKVLGIGPQGHLLLQKSDQTICEFSSGDASIFKK
jgi:BirA family biotin operon repressor/biotin-[acetyl-CoA-carboxylase] ligase